LHSPKAGERLVDLGRATGASSSKPPSATAPEAWAWTLIRKLILLARGKRKAAQVVECAGGLFEVRDLFETDLRGVNVVTIVPAAGSQPAAAAALCRPVAARGARIVSHDYDLGPWTFDEMIELKAR